MVIVSSATARRLGPLATTAPGGRQLFHHRSTAVEPERSTQPAQRRIILFTSYAPLPSCCRTWHPRPQPRPLPAPDQRDNLRVIQLLCTSTGTWRRFRAVIPRVILGVCLCNQQVHGALRGCGTNWVITILPLSVSHELCITDHHTTTIHFVFFSSFSRRDTPGRAGDE